MSLRAGWLSIGLVVAVLACGKTADDVASFAEVDGAAGSSAGSAAAGASGHAGEPGIPPNGGTAGTSAPDVAAGAAGVDGAVESNCEIEFLESDCRVGAVATLSCSSALRISVAEQGGRTWLYLPEAPADFSALHAVTCRETEAFSLSRRPPGNLLSSFDELPYVVDVTDDALALYRGLPDAITVETTRVAAPVSVAAPIKVFIGPESVTWWQGGFTADGLGHQVELHEAPSLEEPPLSAVYEAVDAMSPRLYLYQGRPSAIVRRDGEWHAANTAGITALATAHGGDDWSFDGASTISLSDRWTPRAVAPVSSSGLIAGGLEPELAAVLLAEQYGLDTEEAERLANESPLSPDYVPAPVLTLGNGWQSGVCMPDNAGSSCTWSSSVTHSAAKVMERAEARLGRDSAGRAWLVAVHERADSTCVTTPSCTEAACQCYSSTQFGTSMLELVFRRLALPSTELRFPLPSASYTLWVDGAVGGVVLETPGNGGRTLTIWRFDLDAL